MGLEEDGQEEMEDQAGPEEEVEEEGEEEQVEEEQEHEQVEDEIEQNRSAFSKPTEQIADQSYPDIDPEGDATHNTINENDAASDKRNIIGKKRPLKSITRPDMQGNKTSRQTDENSTPRE